MSCYLCKSDNFFKRKGSVRDNKEIDILECNDCGLVYLSTLKHIKSDHYEKSGMHDYQKPDIKKWLKDTEIDDKRRYDFIKTKIENKNVLDFGCGAGGFIEMTKKTAQNVSGIELESALQSSFIERDLNVFPSLNAAKENGDLYDIITAFHVVEHLQNPVEILKDLSELISSDGEIIVEVPNADDALLTLYDNKEFQNFTYWSLHLFLFNKKTIKDLIAHTGLNFNWIRHIQRYPLSNHMYWLAKGLPGGQNEWSFLNTKTISLEYEKQLSVLGKTDTIIFSMSK